MSQTRTKTKAEENPWYILMTLHEETPGSGGSEAQIRNRLAWNRYVAAFLDPRKAKIAAADARVEAGDLIPLSLDERSEMLSSFRAKAGASADLPVPRNNIMDLSNLDFSGSLSLTGAAFAGVVTGGAIGNISKTSYPPNTIGREQREFDKFCAKSDPGSWCSNLQAAADEAISMASGKMLKMLNDDQALFGTVGWQTHTDDMRGRLEKIYAIISLGEKLGCDMSKQKLDAAMISIPASPKALK